MINSGKRIISDFCISQISLILPSFQQICVSFYKYVHLIIGTQSISDSMDMNLNKLQETAGNRGVWCAVVHRVAELDTT